VIPKFSILFYAKLAAADVDGVSHWMKSAVGELFNK